MTDQREPERMYAGAYAPEQDALCASPIACAVADDWCRWCNEAGQKAKQYTHDDAVHLNALESATRRSPLRKVKP